MDDAERSKREAIRKPRVPTSTSVLSHVVLAAGAMLAADSYGAVLIGATSSTPRSVLASGIAIPTARVLSEVPADSMLDSMTGFCASPLHLVRFGPAALHNVVLGGHRAQPTTITSLTLWEHMVRFNQLRVSQGKTVMC